VVQIFDLYFKRGLLLLHFVDILHNTLVIAIHSNSLVIRNLPCDSAGFILHKLATSLPLLAKFEVYQ